MREQYFEFWEQPGELKHIYTVRVIELGELILLLWHNNLTFGSNLARTYTAYLFVIIVYMHTVFEMTGYISMHLYKTILFYLFFYCTSADVYVWANTL